MINDFWIDYCNCKGIELYDNNLFVDFNYICGYFNVIIGVCGEGI